MVYYSTPLFSIQEAVKSDSSLPPATKIYQDPIKSIDERYFTIINEFKQSETEYREEIRALYGVIGLFDPVYNTYFDNSYDDVTDEMVSFRKTKNQELKQNIKDIAQHHRHLYDYLHDTDIDRAMCNISEWILRANQLYMTYTSMYRIDGNHSKSENYIRKLPLVKQQHLFNFISSLKELVFYFNAKPSTASLISNLEIGLHQLKKSLEQSHKLARVDNDIKISNCKDISSLKPISITLSINDLDLENSFKCKLFYFHKIQSVSMNFEKVELAFIKNSKFRKIVLLEIDGIDRNLIFSPLSENEFKFVQKVDERTIQFDNYNENVQLFFTMDENTKAGCFDKLASLFPATQNFKIENTFKGLGINQLSPVKAQLSSKVLIKELDSSLSFIPNDIAKKSQVNKSMNTATKENLSKRVYGTKLTEKFIQDIIEDNNSSDDDIDMGDYDEMSIVSMDISPVKETFSNNLGHGTQLVSLDSVDIEKKEPLMESNKSSTTTTSLPAIIKKNSSSMSIISNTSIKPRTFMGKLSNLLRRDNSSNASLILEQSSALKINKNTPSSSLSSTSSTSSLQDSLLHISNNLNKCTKFQLPSAKVSYWKNQSWTEGSIKSIKLLSIESNGKYLGIYDDKDQLNPSTLIKITSRSTCQSYSLDLHYTSVNQDNLPIVVLFRTSNSQNQNVLKSAIEDYDFKSMSGSSSATTFDTKKTIGNLKNAIPYSSSWKSMKSDNTKASENLSWNGLGSTCILNDGKMKKYDRCVISITSQQQLVTIELTGYEFGKMDIQLRKDQVSKFSSDEGVKILLNDKTCKYILGFDSFDQLNEFHNVCV